MRLFGGGPIAPPRLIPSVLRTPRAGVRRRGALATVASSTTVAFDGAALGLPATVAEFIIGWLGRRRYDGPRQCQPEPLAVADPVSDIKVAKHAFPRA